MLSALNSEKRNTEDTKMHGEPQRNRPSAFRRPILFISSRASVLSVAFLDVLCVKFRKAQHRGHKDARRTTEKSALRFPSSISVHLVEPQCSLWLFSAFSVLNSEKRNTEATKIHGEPQRNRPSAFRRPFLFISSRASVLSVAFLGVLCVKFRKAQHRGHNDARRTTEKSALRFPSSISVHL